MATMNIDQSRRFTIFSMGEVWDGPSGTGDYVPNLNDLIFDPNTDTMYKVTNVNYTTGISQRQQITFKEMGGANDQDVLIGIGPGAPSEAWRISANVSLSPFQARVDTRMYVNGNDAAYIKVFKDTNWNQASSVISAMYDQNNQYVSDNVPVQGTGVFRTISSFYLKENVVNGQPVYLVVYNAAGTAIADYRMLIHVTDFIPNGNIAVKHVTGIELESYFLSQTEADMLEVPVNLPVSSLMLTARVHYSDGSSKQYQVDGSKFSLLNLQPFAAAIPDQRINIRLKYVLGSDESGDDIYENNGERFTTKQYVLKVLPLEEAYSVKLMCFPDWNPSSNVYSMSAFLYSLDREESWDVSSLINFGITGDEFTGVPGSGARTHVVTVDLEDVDPIYTNFRYLQVVPADLLAAGDSTNTRWEIKNDENSVDLYAVEEATVINETTQYKMNFGLGKADLTTWLNDLYLSQGPLYNSVIEIEPLAPTHFRVVFGGQTVQTTINNWNQDIVFPNAVQIDTGRTIIIEFLREDGPDMLVLGAGAVSATVV